MRLKNTFSYFGVTLPRVLCSSALIAMILAFTGASSTGAATTTQYQATYSPDIHATSAQLKAEALTLKKRLTSLDEPKVHVALTHGDIIVSAPNSAEIEKIDSELAIGIGEVYFRPVLCYAPRYMTPKTGPVDSAVSPGVLPASCPPRYQLVSSNLHGSPSDNNGVQYDDLPDPALAEQPSTKAAEDNPESTVLEPGVPNSGLSYRYLMGPAQLSGTIIKSAKAQRDQTGQWVVDIALTRTGSTGWDTMTQNYFHEVIGIEVDGIVQAAPITQPNANAWSSFGGSIEMSGNYTKSSARSLALALHYGSLGVRLNLLHVSRVSVSESANKTS